MPASCLPVSLSLARKIPARFAALAALLLSPGTARSADGNAPAPGAVSLWPIYEQTFNSPDSSLEFRNGAKLGGPGTGVSGKHADLAYLGVPSSSENTRNSPIALTHTPITPRAESAFTCVFWYFLDENGPELQVPLNSASVLYLLKPDGFELRIQQLPAAPWGTNFNLGRGGPYLDWRTPNRWIFAAFAWKQEGHTLSVYQATHVDEVALVHTIQGTVPTQPTLPRTDLGTRPEVIGGNLQTDRPLAGRLDNIRHFDRALTLAELAAIRRADLENQPLPMP